MSRFIRRDPKDPTKINGHFANRQPGIAEEEVPDDHPLIVAYKNERRALEEEARLSGPMARIKSLEAQVAELAKRVSKLEGGN